MAGYDWTNEPLPPRYTNAFRTVQGLSSLLPLSICWNSGTLSKIPLHFDRSRWPENWWRATRTERREMPLSRWPQFYCALKEYRRTSFLWSLGEKPLQGMWTTDGSLLTRSYLLFGNETEDGREGRYVRDEWLPSRTESVNSRIWRHSVSSLYVSEVHADRGFPLRNAKYV